MPSSPARPTSANPLANSPASAATPEQGAAPPKRRAGAGVTQERAARLLITPSALGELSLADAKQVLEYMKPKRISAGSVFIREGEQTYNDYMMLVLDGDVAVEGTMPGEHENIVVSIMGPGSLIGEMGVIDGGPRSASCRADTALAVAVLSRSALRRLIAEQPAVSARLLLAMSKRMADRLRETNHKLKRFVLLSNTLKNEVYRLMDSKTNSGL
jgi:CRP-like cAMP-binding protein